MKEINTNSNIPDPVTPRSYPELTPIIKWALILPAALTLLFGYMLVFPNESLKELRNLKNKITSKEFVGTDFDMKKFTSVEDFNKYLEDSTFGGYGYYGGVTNTMMVDEVEGNVIAKAPMEYGLGRGSGSEDTASRVSTTNVQVEGVDEPDIVKVDDKSIFVSIENYSYFRLYDEVPVFDTPVSDTEGVMYEDMKVSPPYISQETKIINAFPPSEMEKIGGVDKIGNLLLSKNVLIVFTYDTIYGYDVTDRSSPEEIWIIPYSDNTTYKDARLYGDEVYLVTQTYLNLDTPCPYTPLLLNGADISFACEDIYHPTVPIDAGVTYTVIKINPETGNIDDRVSFLGDSSNSVLYMSENNIYLTYSYNEDYLKIFTKFLDEDGAGLFPASVISKLKKVSSYDIGSAAKMTELSETLQNYMSGLSNDEMMRIENELSNKMTSFTEKYVREFESTGIVKVSVDNLNIEATGRVPGSPLNQFSLDEYRGNLRIATNSGSSLMFGGTSSINDVYVLNALLKVTGSVKDLGEGERIYATRFIGNRGYVVTFRETDPFYVLDLSNPNKPELKGELKIPGFSSYLHQVSDDLILGIGREDSKVKISLFDVSDAKNPVETDKYSLDEYWTDVSNTHHAFLMDSKHGVFFMPGSKGGYIFSYEGDKLELVKTVSSSEIKRAVYMDDYMYLVGGDEIVVLDEKNWDTIKEFKLD